jgi:hypothetical protein
MRGGSGAHADDDDDDVYEHHQQHRIKCVGFFGSLGPASSSYWLSAAEGAGVGEAHEGAAADNDLHLHQDHHRGDEFLIRNGMAG